ncbi:Uncharacterized protein Adt_27158 [Abeliophyllum distichum]|uniref:DUF4216 domain-containing protein n=1 Tax=Abeliophyllum distichum TaxID=126358 RepID=A0ABD1RSZ2_9LAMI
MSVNSSTRWYDSDPYILATMAKQVFYVNDTKAGGGWKVVQNMDHRNIYNIPQKEMYNDNDDNNEVAYQETSSLDVPNMVEARNYNVIQTMLYVDDVPPILINPETNSRPSLTRNDKETDNESDGQDDDDSVEKISEHSLDNTNRVVPSLSHTSQSPNTSIPPTRKIGIQSTTETIVTCTAPLIETIHTHTHPEAPLRTLPNQGTQYGLPGDNLDRPPSRYPGREQDSVIGAGRLPRTPDDVPTRGACKQIKTSRIVRTTQEKIRVLYNSVSRRATSSRVHSLLVHDIGAIIRSHCPMNTCYWRTISSIEKKDLMDEITTNFEIDSKDSRLTDYVNRLYNGRYREFKAELSAYYKLWKTHEVALANPPLEMLDRGVDQWVELCNHFNSDKFKEGSKFPEVDAFEFAYAGKNKLWTDSAAKAQHDEILVKDDEYLTERANEQQLPEDTLLEEIHVDDPDAGLKIMMSVLGVKRGRQIRGLGDERL